MKVVLGYPFAGHVHGAFTECLTKLAQRKTRSKVDIRGQNGPYIHYNRNQLCKYALETGADYLLQIDCDMEFPPDIIERFVSHKRDLVAGLYYRLTPNNQVSQLLFDRNPINGKFMPIGKRGMGLIEIDGAGTGVMMVSRKVLETLKAEHEGPSHWFVHERLDDENELTDDLSFCNRVRLAGFRMWGDCDLPGVVHWKSIKLSN